MIVWQWRRLLLAACLTLTLVRCVAYAGPAYSDEWAVAACWTEDVPA